MKITKGTIIRLTLVAFVIVNMILKAFGKSPIDVDEGTVAYWLETILEIAVIIVGVWKNNSVSEFAIKADEFLRQLRNTEELGAGGNMTYNQFVSAYLGRSTDWDGVSGTQCVDLIKAYLNEVFGIKAGSWGNAKYYWINFNLRAPLKNNFTKIANTPSFVPKKGDIVVWNGGIGSGGYGHIAIATGEGDTSHFYTYDQNWHGKPMKKVYHSYNCVYGVLRPKDQSKITPKTSGGFSVGRPCTLTTNVKIRTGAGTKYRQKKVSELNASGQIRCTSQNRNDYAVLRKGIDTKPLELKIVGNDIWARIQNGWICLKYNGNYYAK